MKIIRSGSLPSARGPEAWFTGTVRIDAPFQATGAGKGRGRDRHLEPGARTAWHIHPLGQTLIGHPGARLAAGVGQSRRAAKRGRYRVD